MSAFFVAALEKKPAAFLLQSKPFVFVSAYEAHMRISASAATVRTAVGKALATAAMPPVSAPHSLQYEALARGTQEDGAASAFVRDAAAVFCFCGADEDFVKLHCPVPKPRKIRPLRLSFAAFIANALDYAARKTCFDDGALAVFLYLSAPDKVFRPCPPFDEGRAARTIFYAHKGSLFCRMLSALTLSGQKLENPLNTGALFTAVLFDPEIKKLYTEKPKYYLLSAMRQESGVLTSYAQDFLDRGYGCVFYNELPDFLKILGSEKTAIKKLILRTYPALTEKGAGATAKKIREFAKELTPDTRIAVVQDRTVVAVGRVKKSYEYLQAFENKHTVCADWIPVADKKIKLPPSAFSFETLAVTDGPSVGVLDGLFAT